jgi:AAA family ATPase
MHTSVAQHHAYFNNNLHLYKGYTQEMQEVWNTLSKCLHYTVPQAKLSDADMRLYSILTKPPKGVLLHGPRGIGKTRLLSNFTQFLSRSQQKICSIVELNHSMLLKRQVGEVERELHSIFQGAANLAPCAIIVDDIDLLFKNRNGPNVSELDKRLVSCFLSLLDGVNQTAGLFIIATSSNPNAIDPALRRPGRIDKEIELCIPNSVVRKEILQSLIAEYGITDDSFVHELVSKSDGMVYSD